MPGSLKGMVAPTLMLWFCIIAWGAACSLAPDSELSWRADFALRLALPFVMACWVSADARKRGRALCYDYDSFVFFASPFIVPVSNARYSRLCNLALFCRHLPRGGDDGLRNLIHTGVRSMTHWVYASHPKNRTPSC